ncbi:uncharacterized protein IUM83_06715 [Phytophthora cinnamomi]|uniref:uncharacterized protein n=1 Tax=Phytophthora cinnamomi TaxID=4785 RepID=UPI00355A9F21|nr:hypothetical protein IUM83_06715 [Phytophthora cinnamomi]
MEHINHSRYVREGYADIEVLAAVEGLSATDLVDLSNLVGEVEDVNEYFRRSRTGSSPSDTELETIPDSVQTRRELASLFMVCSKFKKENAQLKTHFAQLSGQWEAICKERQDAPDATAEIDRGDFNRLMAEHASEKRALRDQVTKMERQLRTAGLMADSLEASFLNYLVDPTRGDCDTLLIGSDDDEEMNTEKRDATWTPSTKAQVKMAQMKRREADVQEQEQDEDIQGDDDEEVPSTPTRRSKRKLDSASSQSDSAPSTPRSKKKKKDRPGETRRQSSLARKTMSELTPEEVGSGSRHQRLVTQGHPDHLRTQYRTRN